jgi:hypothetical protein
VKRRVRGLPRASPGPGAGAAAGSVLGLGLGAATRELAGTLGMAVLGALIGYRAESLERAESPESLGSQGGVPRRRAVPAAQVRS